MQNFDPILEWEQQKTSSYSQKIKIKVTKPKTLYRSHPVGIFSKFWWYSQFLATYCAVSSVIFAVLMGTMNFNAYAQRLQHWINPYVYAQESENIQEVISRSDAKIVTQVNEEEKLDREVLEAKIALQNPEMVYSRHYSAENLLSNIPLQSAETASFDVAPRENRIIIPKLGKNIPLIDTDHDENTNYTQMHQVFMEELKKGVVRYPGTARPGETGNAFIFGHSSNYPWIASDYNDVFALLDTLKSGDEIIVYYNQKKFIYKVTDRAVVKPGDTKVLDRRDPNKKEISLMTCWPIGTTFERLIIFGELTEAK